MGLGGLKEFMYEVYSKNKGTILAINYDDMIYEIINSDFLLKNKIIEEFENYINETHDEIKFFGLSYSPALVLKQVDQIFYDTVLDDYICQFYTSKIKKEIEQLFDQTSSNLIEYKLNNEEYIIKRDI